MCWFLDCEVTVKEEQGNAVFAVKAYFANKMGTVGLGIYGPY